MFRTSHPLRPALFATANFDGIFSTCGVAGSTRCRVVYLYQDSVLLVLVSAKLSVWLFLSGCLLDADVYFYFPSPPDNQFRMSILERLEQMERRMAEMASQQQSSGTGGGGAGPGTGGAGSGVGGGSGGGGNSSQSQVTITILNENTMHIPFTLCIRVKVLSQVGLYLNYVMYNILYRKQGLTPPLSVLVSRQGSVPSPQKFCYYTVGLLDPRLE